jgi:peptidoglycan/xylan/chitin deacetylase (PgdA/CDA1 family)
MLEMQKAEKVINEIIGKEINLFAPPYGKRGKAVLGAAQDLGYIFILWSIDTIDWKNPPPEVIIQRVVKKIHNGAIILICPTDPTVKALPDVISILKNRGYSFVTVSELIDIGVKKYI